MFKTKANWGQRMIMQNSRKSHVGHTVCFCLRRHEELNVCFAVIFCHRLNRSDGMIATVVVCAKAVWQTVAIVHPESQDFGPHLVRMLFSLYSAGSDCKHRKTIVGLQAAAAWKRKGCVCAHVIRTAHSKICPLAQHWHRASEHMPNKADSLNHRQR
jgi:hypothetical protein